VPVHRTVQRYEKRKPHAVKQGFIQNHFPVITLGRYVRAESIFRSDRDRETGEIAIKSPGRKGYLRWTGFLRDGSERLE
jgi:hypothetical protein